MCPARPLRTWEAPSWSTQRHGAHDAGPAAAASLWLRLWDPLPQSSQWGISVQTHFITMRMATSPATDSKCIIFRCYCGYCTKFLNNFFVACLRIRRRHVSLHKYWHESLRLRGIFLWKAQYGNVPSSPFTHLFGLLAPGSSDCSNLCLLAQGHSFPFSDRHGMFAFLRSSHESFLSCVQRTPKETQHACLFSLFWSFCACLFRPSLPANAVADCVTWWNAKKESPSKAQPLALSSLVTWGRILSWVHQGCRIPLLVRGLPGGPRLLGVPENLFFSGSSAAVWFIGHSILCLWGLLQFPELVCVHFARTELIHWFLHWNKKYKWKRQEAAWIQSPTTGGGSGMSTVLSQSGGGESFGTPAPHQFLPFARDPDISGPIR